VVQSGIKCAQEGVTRAHLSGRACHQSIDWWWSRTFDNIPEGYQKPKVFSYLTACCDWDFY